MKMNTCFKRRIAFLARREVARSPYAGFSILSGACVVLFFYLPIFFNTATAGEYRTPIVLKSATTIQRGTGHSQIELHSAIPADFILEVIPAGGTFTVRFDGDLVATWNDNSVRVGDSFDVPVYFSPNDSSVGEAVATFSYMMRPSYRIDLDSLSSLWSRPFPDLVLDARFPLQDRVPESIIRRYIHIATQDSLFLLGDSLISSKEWEDTVELSFTHTPYPCVELSVSASIRTSLYFTLATDTLCIRYSSDENDTLCWDAQTGFDCQTALQPGWTSFSVEVPCEETADFMVPLCPIRARCRAHVEIGTEVTVAEIKLRYTCLPPTSPLSDAPPVKDTTWLEQDLRFGTDRDDAIFTVPVPLDTMYVNLLSAPNDTLGEYDTLYAGSTYTIAWTSLDSELDACCTDDSLRIAYRDTVPDDSTYCSDIVFEPLPGDNLNYQWTVPNTANTCLEDGSGFRLFIEYYCWDTGRTLYRAWSKTFIYLSEEKGGEQ
jgi:hypothetical protein